MLRCWKQWNIASRLIFHLQMKCGLYRRFFKLLWTKGWNKAKSSAIRSSGRWQKSCCIKGTRKVHSAYICSRFPKLKHISMFYTSTQCDKSGGLLTEVKNTKSAKKNWIVITPPSIFMPYKMHRIVSTLNIWHEWEWESKQKAANRRNCRQV